MFNTLINHQSLYILLPQPTYDYSFITSRRGGFKVSIAIVSLKSHIGSQKREAFVSQTASPLFLSCFSLRCFFPGCSLRPRNPTPWPPIPSQWLSRRDFSVFLWKSERRFTGMSCLTTLVLGSIFPRATWIAGPWIPSPIMTAEKSANESAKKSASGSRSRGGPNARYSRPLPLGSASSRPRGKSTKRFSRFSTMRENFTIGWGVDSNR